MILIDTLRADHLGAYGHPEAPTPNIDGLAREGLLFERAFTVVPTTLASTSSIFTGLLPRAHGVPRNGFVLAEEALTLAERLRDTGYRTAAFVGSFALARRTGIDQGFDVYDEGFRKLEGVLIPQRRGGEVTDAALRWLESEGAEPFFLFVHYFDVHYPYDPPPPYDARYATGYQGPTDGSVRSLEKLRRALRSGEERPAEVAHVRSLYLGEVSYVDAEVGRLLRALRRRGELDRTLLVLLSDHGESFEEHRLEYFNHGWMVYDTTLHIPLILRLPRSERAGARVRSIVRTIDLAPTIYELLGLPPLAEAQGQSVAALTGSEGEPAERPVFAEATRPHRLETTSGWRNEAKAKCVRNARWKYVWIPYLEGRQELYDLSVDSGEEHDLLSDGRPDPSLARVRRDLRRQLALFTSGPAAASTEEVGEETQEALRALGYAE
jgi:arylsulfatase A-like enzyme